MELSKQLAVLVLYNDDLMQSIHFYICVNFHVLLFQEKKNLQRGRDVFYRLLLKQQEPPLYFCCSDSLCLLASNP